MSEVVGAGSRSRARKVHRAAVLTHRTPEETVEGVRLLVDAAKSAKVELLFDAEEEQKHGLGIEGKPGEALEHSADICFVLGGDGATLRALRAYANADVPVFAINFGRIGFLATVDRDGLSDSLARAFAGEFEVVELPALTLGDGDRPEYAVNEVSLQRRSHLNVTNLTYSIAGEEIARGVPCDGLIAATPVGSTGYNLSVGGPIVAWGVNGYAVSLIAPHTLSYRPLVAAASEELQVTNEGSEPVDVVIDGQRTGEIAVGGDIRVNFAERAVGLAQLPGSSFYRRFREKLVGLSS
jgi:NAD+ kinase